VNRSRRLKPGRPPAWWVGSGCELVDNLGVEASVTPRIGKKQPEFATFCGWRITSPESLVCSQFLTFDVGDRTTENRGVPGSSPGLAILGAGIPLGCWIF
jgi:hypothetical protein